MSVSKDLHHLRQNYQLGELTEETASLNPFEQFNQWYEQASHSEIREPNSMVLSTATRNGKPSSRVVLLKSFDEKGFVFYSNYHSRKGQEMNENNQICLLFFWDVLERQVRIEGKAVKEDAPSSDEYFQSRPYESQLSAMVSEQSTEIPSRQYLEDKLKGLHESGRTQRPEDWGGYVLKPDYFEFWQGRPNRLHDRLAYQWKGDVWQRMRLAP